MTSFYICCTIYKNLREHELLLIGFERFYWGLSKTNLSITFMQPYHFSIIEKLNILEGVSNCKRYFQSFVEKRRVNISDEEKLLTALKRFFILEKKAIRKITHKSKIKNYDCLTLSVIACCIANEYGYSVRIGRPKMLSRYYHSVLITSTRVMFKLTGKRRDYDFLELTPEQVTKRMYFIGKFVSLF